MAIRFLDKDPGPKDFTGRKIKFTQPKKPKDPLTLQEQTEQDALAAQREDFPVQSALFPRATEAKLGLRKGETVSTGLDLLSLPGRTLAATLGRDKDEDFLESIAKIEDDGFLWDIARDPSTGAAVLSLPAGGSAANLARGLSKIKQLSVLTGIGLAEGVVGAGTTQAEQMTEGKEFQPGQFATEVGVSGALPLGFRLISGLVRGGNKLFGKIASEATGIPEQALRVAATKEGQKQLIKSSGKELQIGEELIDVLDNFDQYIPEREIVNDALLHMPRMNLGNLKVFIERQKIKPMKGFGLSEAEKSVNAQLTNLSNRLGKTKGPGLGISTEKSVLANDYKKLRQQIDDDVDFEKLGSKAFGKLNDKMFRIRTFMKNNLLDAARSADPQGNMGYEDAMKAWSRKLDIKESLDDLLGGKMVNKRQKAANIMGNIFSKNNKVKYGLVKKLDEITNKNFIERAGLAELAEKLGPEGMPGFLPPQRTGAALKGLGAGAATGAPLAGLAISSPKASVQGIKGLNFLQQSLAGPPVSSLGGVIAREAVREQ